MGLWDSLTDLVEAATPWSTVEAEAVKGGSSTDSTPAQPSGGEGEAKDSSAPTPDKKSNDDDTVEGEEASGSDEEEEDEDEEIEDPKEKFEAECAESKQCAPYKHHFDECVERVTGAEEGGAKEDCVEEFFHLAHCANQCAAPKLWAALK